jgi:hypothetical protein
MQTEHKDFLLMEYGRLRDEQEIYMRQLPTLYQYAFVFSGAVWAWLLSHPPARFLSMASFIPFGLSLFLFVESLLSRVGIRQIGKYLQRIEQHFALPHHLGWCREIQGVRDMWPLWENPIWVILCVGNLGMALYFTLAVH